MYIIVVSLAYVAVTVGTHTDLVHVFRPKKEDSISSSMLFVVQI